MISIRENESLAVANGNFVEAVIAKAQSFVSITERKNGEHRLEHPFIAFFGMLRKLRGAENKAERDAIEAQMRADGVTDPAAIDAARKSVKSSWENGRVTTAILKRLHGDTGAPNYSWAPISIEEGSETYNGLVKSLKQSVGGYDGHVDVEAIRSLADGLSVIFANAKNSSITASDLGFEANAMESFLKGETLQLAEAIEVETVTTV